MIRYTEDHGALNNGKPSIELRGRHIDMRYAVKEQTVYLPRYADELTIMIAKRKIAEELHG